MDAERKAELDAAEAFLKDVRHGGDYITGCPHCESEALANGRAVIESWGETTALPFEWRGA